MRSLILLLTTTLTTLACQPTPAEQTPPIDTDRYPEAFLNVLEAHGGLEQWNSMKTLSFERINSAGNERHVIDLQNRMDRIDAPEYQMGFDGQQYWVNADTSFKRDPVFYHNLMFYFYAMPFVLSDEGISYSEATPLVVDSTTTLPGVKMSFGTDVGSSPKDNYIIYYNPDTYQMEWLAYTATYFSQEASDQFSYIKYSKWSDFNDLQLPQALTWYRTAEGQPTEPRNTVNFTAIQITDTESPASAFAPSPGSRIME